MGRPKKNEAPTNVTLDLPRFRGDQWSIVSDPAKIKVIAAGRRWGKSTITGACLVAAAASGGRCAIGAPSYRNTRPMWRWAENAARPLVKSGYAVINRSERTIEFPRKDGGQPGFLGVYTLDNPDSMRGEAFHLVAIDEAARVAEEAWTDVIQPTLADYNGDAFLISTPRGRNWFWKAWKDGQEDGKYIKSWTAPTSDNPIPSIRAAAERAKLHVSDSTYRQEWLAEFVDDAMVYFSPAWWDGQNRYNPLEVRHANTAIARFMSWDTGFKDKEGAAYSACIVVDLMPDYKIQVREVFRERLNFPDLIAAITRIAWKYQTDGKTKAILIEDKASGTSAYQTIVAGSDAYTGSLVQPWMPSGSKEQRAAQAGVWCKNGSVMLPAPADNVRWLYLFEEELYATPHSIYKDQVDAFSQVVIYLEHILRAGYDARRSATGQVRLYSDLVSEAGRTN